MTTAKKGPGLWTAAMVHGGSLADAERINRRILATFTDLTEADFSRRTHFFGGRFENLYLDRDRIPELRIILGQAERWAREILDWDDQPLRYGFWFNAQGPGQSTSEHTHEELDELLSGVYYLSAPEHSGDLILRDGRLSIHVTPEAGLFLFFPPSLSHRVETNRSDALRLSLAFNFGPL
ncbi:putative 2OG-Fe(II) oxygenase [Candidatus Thiosymbion oneisti]|uniref:putative 2OG-Fe(II) oxygenase n=1 Tax=Candidatus Thiosymbion oneisti TaxID=589554 RepID=UPI000B7CF565|nr:putative 2OG-Fe(II) oxygenase [Candidatus Thiosymbion oneisti]